MTGENELQPIDLTGIIPPVGHALIKVNSGTDPMVLSLKSEVTTVRAKADAFTFKDNSDLKVATEDLSIIARLEKALKERQSEWVSPIRDFLESVNAPFKAMLEDLDVAKRTVKDKQKTFILETERKRREAEELDRQAQELARKQAAANGGAFTVDTTPVLRPEVAPTKTHTDLGSTGLRAHWTFEVTDFAALPNEYKVADKVMLGEIARKYHNGKPIPGVRFFDDPGIATYTRG
jgi:hypothetical protein